MRTDRDRIRRGLVECIGIPAFLGLVALAFMALCRLLTSGA